MLGKSRLAPLKPVTIPRMELSTIVLSTRLDRMIRKELEYGIEESFFCPSLGGESRQEISNICRESSIGDERTIFPYPVEVC